MKAYYKVDDLSDEVIETLAEELSKGNLIVYPTETLYALGASVKSEGGLRALIKAKGRSHEKPISVLISDLEMLLTIVQDIPEVAKDLIEKHWPGPLTIIFRSKGLSSLVTARTDSVGVREAVIPGIRKVIEKLGCPITATSANRSGEPAPSDIKDLDGEVTKLASAIIDGGPLGYGNPSTIVDVRDNQVEVIRSGVVQI